MTEIFHCKICILKGGEGASDPNVSRDATPSKARIKLSKMGIDRSKPGINSFLFFYDYNRENNQYFHIW